MEDERVVRGGRGGGVEWAVCATPRSGQLRSGDAFLVQQTEAGVFVAVVDGLGHGDQAADVAQRAVASLRKTAERSLLCSFAAAHSALRGSRGVVMTLAVLDPVRLVLTWAAVGNVDAAVLRAGRPAGAVDRWSVPLRGGVVGDRLPPLRESTVHLAPSDTFVAATDGVSPAFLDAVDLSLDVPDLADRLHNGYARGDDDALVLVARCGRHPR
jgi:phosphoserine phosphatase RsbX